MRLTDPRRPRRRFTTATAVLVAGTGLAACSDDAEPGDSAQPSISTAATTTESTSSNEPDGSPAASPASTQRFPDVVEATAEFDAGSETWTFAVTISSPYDTPERYADGWQIIGPDDSVYGVHTLAHDHAGEQPFTRYQRDVEIPDGVDTVTIEGRDQANGFGGDTVVVELDRTSAATD